jgi:putative ATP-dependent endonuclease of OLD family
LDVDFSAYDPSNFFHALRVHASESGEVRTIEELGSGQEQILALSFIQAYARAFHDAEGLILVIDEPEANLHPLAQDWLARKISNLAASGIQVVITTLSPAFLDVSMLPGLILVRKNERSTETIQMTASDLAQFCQEHGGSRSTDKNILGFYAAAATQEILSGFFARKIVLVEGPTEAAALPIYLEHVGFIPAKDGVAVIAVHGVGNLAKWWRFFSAYGIPTYVVFDNDTKDDVAGAKRSDLLTALGVAEDRQSAYLSTSEWVVEEKFSVFGADFETIMRARFQPDYDRLEEEARRLHRFGRDSKPLVARYVAQRLPLEEYREAIDGITRLGHAIERLGER